MNAKDQTKQSTINLGQRLRQLRREHDLTLSMLSERSGVGVSTLSKIENDKLSPTFDTLVSLAHGLAIDIEKIFSDGEAKERPLGRRSVTRRGQGIRYFTEAYDYEMLCGDVSNKKLVPIRGVLKANSREQFGNLISHDGEEVIYVIAGEVELYTDFYEPLLLQPGDCVFLDSNMGHACVTHGEMDAEILWVCSDRNGIVSGSPQR